MFNERKVAQMAAYLLKKRGGCMAHLKLMKLLYLADREAMARYGVPISGDRVVSMPHGPVLTMTLNLMDGDVESSPNGWDAWISDKANNELSLNRELSEVELDELSQADIEVLEDVWAKFGKMSRWEIRDYTHTLPEWEDPNGSSNAIPHRKILMAMGRSEEEAAHFCAEIEAERALDKLFASI